MNEREVVHGIVLSSVPVGEADRRLTILTGEMGRITAFARGARRPGSPLVAPSRALTYGEMTVFMGRNSNALDSVDKANYFDEVVSDLEKSCYGSYFAEFADYYAEEGLEDKEAVRILYGALTALGRGLMPAALIKPVYELRMMVNNGEYSQEPAVSCGQAAAYAWKYAASCPVERLFSFGLDEAPLAEFTAAVNKLKDYYIDRKFKSLEMLEMITK